MWRFFALVFVVVAIVSCVDDAGDEGPPDKAGGPEAVDADALDNDASVWVLERIEDPASEVGEPEDLPRHCHCYGGQHWYKARVE